MKKYTIKPTKEQLAIMKLYWAFLKQEEINFYNRVYEVEKLMAKQTGIKDILFFQTESGFSGIGNTSRTMPLIQDNELEKN